MPSSLSIYSSQHFIFEPDLMCEMHLMLIFVITCGKQLAKKQVHARVYWPPKQFPERQVCHLCFSIFVASLSIFLKSVTPNTLTYLDISSHIKSNLLTYAEMKNLDLHISVICTLVYTRHIHTAWIKVLGHTFQSLNSGVSNLTE